jgi:hypothetical protein
MLAAGPVVVETSVASPCHPRQVAAAALGNVPVTVGASDQNFRMILPELA